MCRIAKEIDIISIPPHIFHTGQIDIQHPNFNSWPLKNGDFGRGSFPIGNPGNFSGDQLAGKNHREVKSGKFNDSLPLLQRTALKH